MPEVENIQRNFVDSNTKKEFSLKRAVGLGSAVLMVAGSMIGTGIFKKIVPMAATGLNESYILLAWTVAGLISLFGAFTVAGLAKVTTESGGIYEYLRVCFGNFTGFLFGWGTFIIMGSGSVAAVAFIFSQSLAAFVPVPELFHSWSDISIAHSVFPFADAGIKIISIIVIVLITLFNYLGIKKGSRLNDIVTIAKISGIIFLVLLGIFFGNASGSLPTASTPIAEPHGFPLFSIFFAVMLSALWAYDGAANVAAISGEIRNPQKNIPLALVIGVSSVMALYLLVNFAFMKSVPLNVLASLGDQKVAAIVVAENILGRAGTLIISLLILISAFGWLNIGVIFYSRYYFRMAQENSFFKSASKVHPVYRTPYVALFISMFWSCILVISGSFDVLTDMVIIAGHIFIIMLAIGLIKLKRNGVIKEKVAAYPAAPVIFIFFTLLVIVNTFIQNFERSIVGLLLVLSGVPVYYLFRMRNQPAQNG